MYEYIDKILSEIDKRLSDCSRSQKIILLIIIWLVLFLPSVIHHSVVQKDEHLRCFPEDSAPSGFDADGWSVTTTPQSLANSTDDGRLKLNVSAGETVDFRWVLEIEGNNHPHIGAVNVFYRVNGGHEKQIWLNKDSGGELSEVWSGEKIFKDGGEISYYYRAEKTDIAIFNRRASVIIEGKNPYEETRTGPPPVIHFFFIPPALLSAPVEWGAYFLSFNIYFALFLLLDTLIIFKCLSMLDRKRAYLLSLVFLVNPLTIMTLHQDEAIIVFLLLLPLYLLIKNRKYVSSAVGFGMIAKAWSAFWIPVILLLDDTEIRERLIHLIIASSVAGGMLIFFRVIWGPKVLWFLSFYGGSAERSSLGGISFWNTGDKILNISDVFPLTIFVLLLIALLEIIVMYIAWKKKVTDIRLLTMVMAVFLAIYPKIHWEYYLIIFPPLIILGSKDVKYVIVLYSVSILAVLTTLLKQTASTTVGQAIVFFFSILISATLLWSVYEIYIEGAKSSDLDTD